MLSWFYSGGFLGTSFVWENCFSRTGTASACAPSARRQHPCCRPLQRCVSSSKMNIALTGVALVARPCAPDAQRADDSSNSRSRLAKSYGRFAPLDLKQDCFFRVPLPKIKCLVQSAFGGQRDFRPPINFPKAPFRQLSKVADASQPLEFEKQSSLRTKSA